MHIIETTQPANTDTNLIVAPATPRFSYIKPNIDRDGLGKLVIPKPDKRWHPLDPALVVDELTRACKGHDLGVLESRIEVVPDSKTNQPAKFFGQMFLSDLQRAAGEPVDDDEFAWTVGWRGSWDKSTRWSIAGGNTVMVCSNMCFDGEHVIGRKNTANARFDLPQLINEIVGKLRDVFESQAEFLRSLKGVKPLSDAQRNDFLIKLAESGAIGFGAINTVLSEWRKPSTEAFEPHRDDLWGLHNAVTERLKSCRGETIPTRTTALNTVMRSVFGELLSAAGDIIMVDVGPHPGDIILDVEPEPADDNE